MDFKLLVLLNSNKMKNFIPSFVLILFTAFVTYGFTTIMDDTEKTILNIEFAKERIENLNFKQVKKSAKKGDVESMILMGHIYRFGLLEQKADDRKALANYQLAASKKHPEGLYCMAYLYEIGVGVNKNELEMMRHLEESADMGYLKAQNDLGFYLKENPTAKSRRSAEQWLEMAAEQDSKMAQNTLGEIYNDFESPAGKMKANFFKAKKWFMEAGNTAEISTMEERIDNLDKLAEITSEMPSYLDGIDPNISYINFKPAKDLFNKIIIKREDLGEEISTTYIAEIKKRVLAANYEIVKNNPGQIEMFLGELEKADWLLPESSKFKNEIAQGLIADVDLKSEFDIREKVKYLKEHNPPMANELIIKFLNESYHSVNGDFEALINFRSMLNSEFYEPFGFDFIELLDEEFDKLVIDARLEHEAILASKKGLEETDYSPWLNEAKEFPFENMLIMQLHEPELNWPVRIGNEKAGLALERWDLTCNANENFMRNCYKKVKLVMIDEIPLNEKRKTFISSIGNRFIQKLPVKIFGDMGNPASIDIYGRTCVRGEIEVRYFVGKNSKFTGTILLNGQSDVYKIKANPNGTLELIKDKK